MVRMLLESVVKSRPQLNLTHLAIIIVRSSFYYFPSQINIVVFPSQVTLRTKLKTEFRILRPFTIKSEIELLDGGGVSKDVHSRD